MKVRQILLCAWRTYTAHFGALLQGFLLQAVVCLIALAPLLFLSVPQAAPLAWLCPVLFVLLVLPMRQNAAQALASLLDGAEYPLGQVVSFQDYGRKLLCSLRQGLWLVVWGLPCLAVTVGMSMAYNGLVDAFTLMRFFMDLGGGKFTQGLLVGFGIYALTVLLLLVGMAFLSWRRHGDARQLPGSAVRGHRLRLLVANLAGALTYVPFLVAVALIGRGYVSQLLAAISGLATGSVTLPPLTDNLYLVGIAFLVLLYPLLPLKALIPAAFAQALPSKKATQTEAAEA